MSFDIPCERKLFESLKIKIVVQAGLFGKLLFNHIDVPLRNIVDLIKKVEPFHYLSKTIVVDTEIIKNRQSRRRIEILINNSL